MHEKKLYVHFQLPGERHNSSFGAVVGDELWLSNEWADGSDVDDGPLGPGDDVGGALALVVQDTPQGQLPVGLHGGSGVTYAVGVAGDVDLHHWPPVGRGHLTVEASAGARLLRNTCEIDQVDT